MDELFPISVVVPTHNRSRELPKIIQLIEKQDYPANLFEIVVVDNASTDRTADVVQELIEKSTINIKYVFESRHGVTQARNRGVDESSFDYSAIIDDDCKIGREWLRQLIKGFQLHPDIVAVGGLVYIDWQCPRPHWINQQLEAYLGATGHLGNEMRVIANHEQVVEFNFMIKKAAWREAGGFLGMESYCGNHLSASEILPLLLQFRKKNWKVGYVPGAKAGHEVSHKANIPWLIRRCYWQGIGDALLSKFVYRNSGNHLLRLTLANMRGMFKEVLLIITSFTMANISGAVYHMCVSITYCGRIIGDIFIKLGIYQGPKISQ